MNAELVAELLDEAEKMWQQSLATAASHNKAELRRRGKLYRKAARALAALGDTVPREQYDALAAVIERAKRVPDRDEVVPISDDVRRHAYVKGGEVRASRFRDILDTAPAVSLALHNAEVKAQALDEFADAYCFDAGWRQAARARAAAIREEAN